MQRKHVLVTATAGFSVLYLAGATALGTPPDGAASAGTVASWFAYHGDAVRLWLWFLVVSAPLFGVYAALVRTVLPSPHRDVFFLGAALFMAETAVQGWLWAALALHPRAASPGTMQLLFSAASYWGPVLIGSTLLMLLPVAHATWGGRDGWPRWLGPLAALVALEQLAETVTVFGKDGFTAPGGPMNVYVGALATAVALIALGLVAARRQPVAPL